MNRQIALIATHRGGASAGIEFVPQQNVLASLVAWVEEGIVPETIGGVKFVNDTVSQGIAMERQHCRLVSRPVLFDYN